MQPTHNNNTYTPTHTQTFHADNAISTLREICTCCISCYGT